MPIGEGWLFESGEVAGFFDDGEDGLGDGLVHEGVLFKGT